MRTEVLVGRGVAEVVEGSVSVLAAIAAADVFVVADRLTWACSARWWVSPQPLQRSIVW